MTVTNTPDAPRPRLSRKLRPASVLAALFALPVALAARPAAAQEIEIRGPLRACNALLVREAVPAVAEWSWWVAGGGGVRVADGAHDGLGVLGLGTEMTTGLATLGNETMYGGLVELRWGPWMGVVTDLHGARSEGGLLLSVGQVRHAQWGTYALRIGAGLGDDDLGRVPHVVATLTGGVRYVKERYSSRGTCDPPAVQKPSALASGLRLFASARAGLASDSADGNDSPWQLTFGIELEPTFLLPPYRSLGKWIGAE